MPTGPEMLPVLATLLAVAAASDVALHRIPNALAVGVLATGLFARLVSGAGALGVVGSVAAVVAVAAIAWPAWARGWLGGGDLKLAAATSAWLGLEGLPTYAVASAASIGVVSLVCYAASARAARSAVRRNLAGAARGVSFTAPLGTEDGRVQVPAGVGFAVGALVTLSIARGF